jgi:hypothetical protein
MKRLALQDEIVDQYAAMVPARVIMRRTIAGELF